MIGMGSIREIINEVKRILDAEPEKTLNKRLEFTNKVGEVVGGVSWSTYPDLSVKSYRESDLDNMSNLRELTEAEQIADRMRKNAQDWHDSIKDTYEGLIVKAMQDAGSIQEFLWDDISWSNKPFDAEEWSVLFQKRVDKIKDIDTSSPNWKVEVRKRLLQQASLSLKAIMALQENNI